MSTTHEDSRSDDDLVSIAEERNGRYIYCRLCQRGNSPADHELDHSIVEDVFKDYPQLAAECKNGDEDAFAFVYNRILQRHQEVHGDESPHPRAMSELLKRYLGGMNSE